MGRADLKAASAAAAMASSSILEPTSAVRAASTRMGRDATAVTAMRASATVLPSMRTAAASPTIGKSKEPRSRALRYVLRHPSATGSLTSVTISSRRIVRYRIPSSW